MKKLMLGAFMMAGVMTFTACDDDDDNNQNPPQSKTIAATVESDSRFTILLDALERTSLTSALADASAEFTVFAPNDAAFQALLQDMNFADLDEAENQLTTEGLKNLLLYHVLEGEMKSGSLSTGYYSTMSMAGAPASGNLSLYTQVSTGVMLNGEAMVEDADIDASNGVIHEINAVIMPKTTYELISMNTATYSSLSAALNAADGNLAAALSSSSQANTVFAPSNAAFSELIANTPGVNNLNELVAAVGTDGLRDVLLYHLVPGNNRAEALSSGSVNTALSGTSIMINVGNQVTITDGAGSTSTVTKANIQGTNGVVHSIDGVLMPQ